VQLDPDLASDHNGLCLKDMSSSNFRVVHSQREKITGIQQ